MSKRVHYLESDMDETSRLILLDHKGMIDADKFKILFREQHPGVSLSIVWFQWKKWHGTKGERPTHDYVYGHKYVGIRKPSATEDAYGNPIK